MTCCCCSCCDCYETDEPEEEKFPLLAENPEELISDLEKAFDRQDRVEFDYLLYKVRKGLEGQ